MAGLVNAGDGQLLRKNDVAQLVDGFFLLVAFCILEFLQAIENSAKIPR